MAKHAKRRSSRRKTHRRRRVSGIGPIDMQGIALAIGGAILANKVQNFLSKDPTKSTLVNLAPFAGLALGIGLPMFVKNPMVKALAVGLTTMGGFSVLKKLAPGIVGNFAMVPTISGGTTNKFRNLPKPSVNGVGFPLPKTSTYKDALSVISGLGNADGSGGAC